MGDHQRRTSVSSLLSSGDESNASNHSSASRFLGGISEEDEESLVGILDKEIAPEDPDGDVDEMMASALNNLTFRQREEINEEIHGINVDRTYLEATGGIEETPELLEMSFSKIAEELETLRRNHSDDLAQAFDHSQRQFGTDAKNTYLNSKDFRLLFLRADRFDCHKAANRLCRYANLLQELWGETALGRRPGFNDLNDREKNFCKTGRSQLLPARDRAGRRIYVHFANDKDFPGCSTEEARKSRMRTSIYISMALVEGDIASQRLGVVFLFFMHNTQLDKDDYLSRGRSHPRLAVCLPIRVGAAHYCFASGNYGVMSMLVANLSTNLVPHLRIHTGSLVECIYALQSFGIPAGAIPINTSTGELLLTNQHKFLDLMAAIEAANDRDTMRKRIIECPLHSDILFGRGQIVMKHPGNTMFRNLIQSKLKEYSIIQTKKESTQLTWDIVRILKNVYGARFLKEDTVYTDSLCWVEVSNEVARSKVRIAFRDARTRLAKNSQKDSLEERDRKTAKFKRKSIDDNTKRLNGNGNCSSTNGSTNGHGNYKI